MLADKPASVWKFLLVETDTRISETIDVRMLQNLTDHNKSVLINHVLLEMTFI